MQNARAPDDVLIVGAGPTGLTLANALISYGVKPVIIERKTSVDPSSKALVINVATQFGFELLGMGREIGASGQRIHRANILWQGKQLCAVDFRRLRYFVDSFIAQPQCVTESELAAALQRRGGTVRFNTRLLKVSQESGHVNAEWLDEDRNTVRRQFRYAIGCDGKASVVRAAMDVKLEGVDYPMHFLLGDFKLRWDRPDDEAFYYVWDNMFFIIIPLGDGIWRVVLKRSGSPPDSDAVTACEIVRPIEAMLGESLFDGDALWISQAPFYMRVCDTLHQGRLLLAGDSAHLFSPIGGTGMNTGMQDAMNLAWKLAYRLRGAGTDALLGTYTSERMPAIRAAAAGADQATRLISRLDRDENKLAPFQPQMRNRQALRTVLPRMHSGMGLSYDPPAGTSTETIPAGCLRPGQLCRELHRFYPNARRHAGPSDLPPFALIVNCQGMTQVGRHACGESLSMLAVKYGATLFRVVFADSGAIGMVAPDGSSGAMTSSDLAMAHAMGVTPGWAILVRPDGIVCRAAPADSLSFMQADMDRMFTVRCDPAPMLQQARRRSADARVSTSP